MDFARLSDTATLEAADVLLALGSTPAGLSDAEAARRLGDIGPNALPANRATAIGILGNQLRNPLLPILVLVAVVSGFTGQRASSAIIAVIAALSVALGFVNEYRSAKAVEQLHAEIRHLTTALREGDRKRIDVTEMVPGDVVELSVGDVVPADLRLLATDGLTCDESVLTGESMPSEKRGEAAPPIEGPLGLANGAFMGTVVRTGTGRGVVALTGSRTELGGIARQLNVRQTETSFQRGLREFGNLLVRITAGLVLAIFAINVALGRPLLDAVLFSLAIAVGLTPELLPAIVTISLSSGAKRMARKHVLVRRLIAIEDFGNIQVLFTDKTGTLTEGRTTYREALDPMGTPSGVVLLLGLVCSEVVLEHGRPTGGTALDQALWSPVEAPEAATAAWRPIDRAAFDYDRRRMSVLADGPEGRVLVTKGAPEAVLAACGSVPVEARAILERELGSGTRLVAVATRDGSGMRSVEPPDERDLRLAGFLAFVDPPKPDAATALERLARLGIDVRVITGDNDLVARAVCEQLGVRVRRVLTGAEMEGLPDEELAAAIASTTIFARATPDQKARIVRLAREHGMDVGFMGDGVNDAVALHQADVGISVDSAADVAKDAADILLLEKDLGILADGVVEGRRIFANTIKYVLMATSSNFGNMFSAAAASAFLPFLPMLPAQILLNNLLYDASQTTIPTDRVDEDQLRRPAHWDTLFIRRFMAFFGPISSLFDFATFAVMLWVFDAGPALFRTGWFVESLATQTLVIFVIRTRRIPFFQSRPSRAQLAMTLACAGLAIVIPYLPWVGTAFGFTPPPPSFLAIVGGFVVVYLALAEAGKARFFRARIPRHRALAVPHAPRRRRVQRIAWRWRPRRTAPS